ncbi:hypothetical protein SeMB42_g02451 [Synchytrium endobioticum]|uniref:Uncharacterized protein n=1 Tax=Synchytrium endobioticum TaxID=286115 RepID=A0A507DDW8_9FUNG|nr:hypothetical protein SeMB42_g02451 [Synchytrium endobioticum]
MCPDIPSDTIELQLCKTQIVSLSAQADRDKHEIAALRTQIERDKTEMAACKANLEKEKAETARFTKENTALKKEKFNSDRDKSSLDKELKKVQAVIAKDKNKMALQESMAEVSKLKGEMELLSEFKHQNDALKDEIRLMAATADKTRKLLEEKVSKAMHELEHIRAGRQPSASVLEELSLSAHSAASATAETSRLAELEAELALMRADTKAAGSRLNEVMSIRKQHEATIKQSKADLDKLNHECEDLRLRLNLPTQSMTNTASATLSAAPSITTPTATASNAARGDETSQKMNSYFSAFKKVVFTNAPTPPGTTRATNGKFAESPAQPSEAHTSSVSINLVDGRFDQDLVAAALRISELEAALQAEKSKVEKSDKICEDVQERLEGLQKDAVLNGQLLQDQAHRIKDLELQLQLQVGDNAATTQVTPVVRTEATANVQVMEAQLVQVAGEPATLTKHSTEQIKQLSASLIEKESELDSSKQELTRTRCRIQAVESGLEAAQQQNDLLNAQIQTLQQDLESYRSTSIQGGEAAALHITALQSHVESIEADLQASKKEAAQQQIEASAVQAQVESNAKEASERAREQMAVAQQNLTTTESENRTLNELVCSLRQQVDALSAAHGAIQSELEAARQQLACVNSEFDQYKHQVTEIQSHLTSSQQELEASKQQLASSRQIIEASNQELAQAVQKLHHVESELEGSKGQNSILNNTVVSLQSDMNSCMASHGEAQPELEAERRGEIEVLHTQIEQLESELRQTRHQLEESVEAAREVAVIRTELEDAKKQLERNSHVSTTNQALEVAIKEREEQATGLQAEITRLHAAHAESEDAIRQEVEMAVKERDSAHSQMVALQTKITELTASHEASKNDFLTRHEVEVETVRKDSETARQELEFARKEHIAAQQQIEALHTELAALHSSHDLLQNSQKAEVDSLKTSVETMTQELQARTAELESSRAEGLTYKQQLDNTQRQLDDVKAELEATRLQLEESNRHSAAMEKQSKDGADAEIEIRKQLEESRKQMDTANKQVDETKKQLEKVERQLDAAKADTKQSKSNAGSREKELEAKLADVEAAKTKAMQAKDAAEVQVKALNGLVAQAQAESAKLKKERTELEDRIKRDKQTIEETHKKTLVASDDAHKKEKTGWEDALKTQKQAWEKEKTALEEANKKNLARITDEKSKLQADLDKAVKDLKTEQASRSEGLRKLEALVSGKTEEANLASAKLKSLESETLGLKAETSKTIEELRRQLKESEAHASQRAELSTEIANLKEEAARLQSKYDVLTQELQVSHSSYERASKAALEKDETVKKARSRIDELAKADNANKKAIRDIEKQRDEAREEIARTAAACESLQRDFDDQKRRLDDASSTQSQRVAELDARVDALKEQNIVLEKKLAEKEGDMRILERKSAQIVKDLQKQLAKQRKGHGQLTDGSGESQESVSGMDVSLQNHGHSHGRSASVDHNRTKTSPTPTTLSDAKDMQSFISDLQQRASHAEEELKNTRLLVSKLGLEVDQKSRIIQQYILRDHSSKLIPDDKPAPAKSFNLNIFSSQAAMVKNLDPVQLAQVNAKMQKLLEELTTKMMNMEEEFKKMKSGQSSGTMHDIMASVAASPTSTM